MKIFKHSYPIIILIVFSCTTKEEMIPIPKTPSSLEAFAISTSEIELNWIDESTNETGFIIERKNGTDNFTELTKLSADNSSYKDAGLTSNTIYTYRVYSYNSSGKSISYSNEAQATTNSLPIISTTTVVSNTPSTAIGGGIVTNDGGSPISARGVVWSLSPNPTIALTTKTFDGTGIGTFSSFLNGLTSNTIYYVRAYAVNDFGTGYGDQVDFKTQEVNITSGLIGYYPFNGNANDESGNKNHGTVDGATFATDRFGNTNSAFHFNNNHIVIPNSSIFSITNYSISLWISSTSSARQSVLAKLNYSSGTEEQFKIILNDLNPNGVQFAHKFGNLNCNMLGTSTPNEKIQSILDGKFHHLVGIAFENKLQLYIDGVLVNQISTGGFQTNTSCFSGDLQIGRNWLQSLDYFQGKIDDIRIYSGPLNQNQITYLATH